MASSFLTSRQLFVAFFVAPVLLCTVWLGGCQYLGICPYHQVRDVIVDAKRWWKGGDIGAFDELDFLSDKTTSPAASRLAEARRAAAGARARNHRMSKPRVFSSAELSAFDGRDPKAPVYLAILGEVFDVSSGRHKYASGDYQIFAGRDASRNFHTGDFKAASTDLRGLDDAALKGVVAWRSFYRTEQGYHQVGVIGDGLYFDATGEPKQVLLDIENRVAQGGGGAPLAADVQSRS